MPCKEKDKSFPTAQFIIEGFYKALRLDISDESGGFISLCKVVFSDMVKHELRVMSYELRVERLKPRVESLKARVEIQMCEFESTSYKF